MVVLAACAVCAPMHAQAQAPTGHVHLPDGSGYSLGQYIHPPMVLPSYANCSNSPPALPAPHEPSSDPYPDDGKRTTAHFVPAMTQAFHPPMVLPPQFYHTNSFLHGPLVTAGGGLAPFGPESSDLTQARPSFGSEIHPPMFPPPHYVHADVFSPSEKTQASGTQASDSHALYSDHVSVSSSLTTSNFLAPRSDELRYGTYTGVDWLAASSRLTPEQYGWDVHFTDTGSETLERSSMSTWSASVHELGGGVDDRAGSNEGTPTAGLVGNSAEEDGTSEEKYKYIESLGPLRLHGEDMHTSHPPTFFSTG